MTTYTELPRPEGHIYVSYSPMSPPNWGIVQSDFHVFVYRDAKSAIQALLQAAHTLHVQRIESGTASLFSDHLYFRGQTDITQRLVPTRLRGPRRNPESRERFPIDRPKQVQFGGNTFPSHVFSAGNKDPREHWGSWYEEIEPMRTIEDSAAELSEGELRSRDIRESAAINLVSKASRVARLNAFQRRAVVRHYAGVPSPLLDVSTDPEVAAFFATGAAKPEPPGQIGLLWAVDLNFLADLFSVKVTSVSGGLKISLTEQRERWGDNKKMFEEFGVLPTRLELVSVELPFIRPQAQKARFLSLSGEDGRPLPHFTELTWWSIIERRSYMCAFLHNGSTYENSGHNITVASLLSEDKKLTNALAFL